MLKIGVTQLLIKMGKFMFKSCPDCTSELISARKITKRKEKPEKKAFFTKLKYYRDFPIFVSLFLYACLNKTKKKKWESNFTKLKILDEAVFDL